MIDTVFGVKVRMSGLSINQYRPIIGRLLDDCLIGAFLQAKECLLCCVIKHSSATSRMSVVRWTYSYYGFRCFAAAGPKLWNSLPADLWQADINFQQFKWLLKTFFVRVLRSRHIVANGSPDFGQWLRVHGCTTYHSVCSVLCIESLMYICIVIQLCWVVISITVCCNCVSREYYRYKSESSCFLSTASDDEGWSEGCVRAISTTCELKNKHIAVINI